MSEQPKTPEEWWGLLNSAPMVAGPWEEYRTEEQRVKLMMVRRLARTGDAEIVAMAYGPHFDVTRTDDQTEKDRNRWIVVFREGYRDRSGYLNHSLSHACLPGSFESVAVAMAAADDKLTYEGWLLVKGTTCPT